MEVKRKKDMDTRDGIHFMMEKKSKNFFGNRLRNGVIINVKQKFTLINLIPID